MLAMASIEILLAVRRLSLNAIDRVTRMLEGLGGAARRALQEDPFESIAGVQIVDDVLDLRS